MASISGGTEKLVTVQRCGACALDDDAATPSRRDEHVRERDQPLLHTDSGGVREQL